MICDHDMWQVEVIIVTGFIYQHCYQRWEPICLEKVDRSEGIISSFFSVIFLKNIPSGQSHASTSKSASDPNVLKVFFIGFCEFTTAYEKCVFLFQKFSEGWRGFEWIQFLLKGTHREEDIRISETTGLKWIEWIIRLSHKWVVFLAKRSMPQLVPENKMSSFLDYLEIKERKKGS